MKHLAILVLALVGCAVHTDPCAWDEYDEHTWRTVEIDNQCELPTWSPAALGCETKLSEAVENDGIQCSKAYAFRCANELTFEAFKARDPDRAELTIRGRDCITRVTLEPR
jgi:hypothetical protein